MTAVNLMSPLRSPGSYFPAAPFPPMAFSKASPGTSVSILASPFKPKCRLCSRFRRSGHDGAFGSRGCPTMQSLSALGSNSAHGDSGEPFPTEDSHKAGGKGVSKQTRRRGDSLSNRLRVDGLSGSRMDVGGGARTVGSRNLKHGDGSRSTSEETGWGRDSGFKGRRGGDFGGGFQRKGSYRDSRNSEKGSIANKRFRNVLDEDEDNEGVSPRSNRYDEIVNGRLMGSSKDLINDNNNYADGNTVPAADAPSDEDPRDDAKKNDKCNGPLVSPLGGGESYLSESRFDHCSISPLSLKGIKAAGYEKMTVVQEATLPFILEGKDVLAKAKTGTGKTVAFLLPSIEAILKMSSVDRGHKCPPVTVLVVCPTRELANQVAKEADKLLRYHPAIGAQVVIGGTRIAQEQRSMQANPCQILIATPGRLKDHLVNTDGFGGRLKGVKVLILDEADQLLDMGFRKAIEEIMASVPKHRQTLLFSATLPSEVRQISHIALKRDHELIDTVPEGAEETHSQVKQTHLVAPLDMQFSIVYALLKEHISDDADYKVLVFCTTAMVTRHVADYLGKLRLNVREIHSRKSQSHRTRISDEFRKSKGLILVTSDVSARGVDYPDVTLVIQIGLPADREQYIHRLGRTGRKGKEGKGILLLAPWENFFLHTIKDLPMMPATEPRVDPETVKQVEVALSQVDDRNKVAAYQAWLGYYNSHKRVGRDKHMVVELANDFGRCLGFVKPPAIPKLVVHKMGLKNIPGLLTK